MASHIRRNIVLSQPPPEIPPALHIFLLWIPHTTKYTTSYKYNRYNTNG